MEILPSKEKYKNYFSRNHLSPEKREEYRKYEYQLDIFLDLTNKVPVYSFLEISTSQNREAESPERKLIIVNNYLDEAKKIQTRNKLGKEILWFPDYKHFGELLFILAAKLKYDLIGDNKYDEDHSGFLHIGEIEKMNPGGQQQGARRTYVGKSVYETLGKLYNPKKEKNGDKLKAFLASFLFESEQLYHLVCYIGSTYSAKESLFWWLNVSAKDVNFRDWQSAKVIANVKLREVLKNLFDERLFDKSKLEKITSDIDSKISDESKIQRLLREASQKSEPPIRQNSGIRLCKPVIAIDLHKNQNLFRYEYRWISFVGREKEMNRLHRFAKYKGENLLWWAVTGKGGTGKNRLALELCLELEKEGWNTGFLADTGQLDSLNDWQPAKPTLIVVDYVFQKARVLGEYFARIYTNAKNWQYPVRFLFLERYEESEALTEFCYPNREIIENNCRFNNIALSSESPALKLEGLEGNYIERLISEIFAKYNKVPSTDEYLMIKNFSDNCEPGRRPLYIMFATDACARNENIRGWDINRLHQSVLEHNKKIWKEAGINDASIIDRKHINLLSFATIVNSVQVELLDNLRDMETDKEGGPEFMRLFPDRYEFGLAKYQIISDSNAIEELPGIVPDVIGEHFILQRWKTSPSEAASFFKLGWQYRPPKVSRFVTYMAMDFPYENTVEKIIEAVLAEKGSDVNKIILLYNLLIIHGDLKDYNALERHLKRLVGIWHNCDHRDTAVYFHFVHALEYIVSIYARTGNLIKAEEHYEYLKVIDSKSPDTSDISLSMAKATKDILLANAKLSRVSNAEICFKSLESICGQHHPNNREIRIQLALGMGSMVYLYSQLKQPDTAREYYGKLQSLWENYPSHSELSWIVSSSMLHLSLVYGSIERYPEARGYVDKLRKLCTSQKYPADILQNYAFSILHLLYCFIEASEKELALKYYNTFKELCEHHPGNKELMLMLSDAKKKYDTLHI